MPDTDVVDYRQTSARELLGALARHEPLALAEAYHRSAAAGHAVAVRLLGTARDVESLLREVYADLWREPPSDAPLEAWVRHRAFARGRERLQEGDRAAASPSMSLLLRDADGGASRDRTEQAIAALDDEALRALLLAHDSGTPTADQRAPEAAAALRRALLALAEADDSFECSQPSLADYVLGLLDDEASEQAADAIGSSPGCAELARALRRGRRRIEGLPPAPDLGQRVIAHVLATGGAVATPAPLAAPDGPTAGVASPDGGWAATEQPEEDLDSAARGGPPPEPDEELESEPVADLAAPEAGDAGDGPRPGDPSDATAAAAGASLASGADEGASQSALDDLVGDLSQPGRDDDVRLSDLLEQSEHVEGAGGNEAPVDEPPPPDATTGALDGEAADPAPARDPIRIGGRGGRSEPSAPTPPAEDEWAAWGQSTDDAAEIRFADISMEDDQPDTASRRRRVGTVLLTIVGALLLLAAGGVAGLLLIRVVLG